MFTNLLTECRRATCTPRDENGDLSLQSVILDPRLKMSRMTRNSKDKQQRHWIPGHSPSVIPAEAGIQRLGLHKTEEKTKTLDSRLRMSGMTEGEESRMTRNSKDAGFPITNVGNDGGGGVGNDKSGYFHTNDKFGYR